MKNAQRGKRGELDMPSAGAETVVNCRLVLKSNGGELYAGDDEEAYSSRAMVMAPLGQMKAQIPQPLQKS